MVYPINLNDMIVFIMNSLDNVELLQFLSGRLNFWNCTIERRFWKSYPGRRRNSAWEAEGQIRGCGSCQTGRGHTWTEVWPRDQTDHPREGEIILKKERKKRKISHRLDTKRREGRGYTSEDRVTGTALYGRVCGLQRGGSAGCWLLRPLEKGLWILLELRDNMLSLRWHLSRNS